jgi:DNA repair protein RadD
MSHTPFPRQYEAISKMEKFVLSKTSKKGLFVYPVAFGKSIVIAHVAALFPDKYFINICPNSVLTKQNYKTYCSYGYEASICSASLGKNEISQVTFATIGTIKKHIEFYKDKEVVILNDEAQNSSLKGSQLDTFIKLIKKCKVVGTTGTPVRLDGGMMGTELKMMNRMRKCFYSSIEDVVQISEVIENKRWSELVYEVENIDESYLQLNTSGTEYTLKSLKAFSDANNLIDKAKEATERLLEEGRKSILIYMPFIEDAEALTKKIPGAEVLHSKISNKKRKQVVDDFKDGKIKVLVNCLILVEGFNYPELSAIIQCRPTNSINQWYQSLGRGTRVHPNKKDCKIIDLSGNFNKFGKIEELVFEEIPYFGWAMLNGKGELLTGYPLASKYKPTRESVIENGKRKEKQQKEIAEKTKEDENPVINFGMWKNRKVWDIARNSKDSKRFKSWCDWFIKEQSKPSQYPKNFILINAINKYLKKDAEEFNMSNLIK